MYLYVSLIFMIDNLLTTTHLINTVQSYKFFAIVENFLVKSMIFVKFLVILHFESDNNMLERNKIEYLVIFIGEFARHFNLGIQQTYHYLQTYKALDFLERQYDVAHTMGFEYMVDAMADYCKRHGGKLA